MDNEPQTQIRESEQNNVDNIPEQKVDKLDQNEQVDNDNESNYSGKTSTISYASVLVNEEISAEVDLKRESENESKVESGIHKKVTMNNNGPENVQSVEDAEKQAKNLEILNKFSNKKLKVVPDLIKDLEDDFETNLPENRGHSKSVAAQRPGHGPKKKEVKINDNMEIINEDNNDEKKNEEDKNEIKDPLIQVIEDDVGDTNVNELIKLVI